MSALRRSTLLLGAAFLAYVLLVATHQGEFWPFSIYPMFSQAGQPWSRAVVREVDAAAALSWQPVTEVTHLPGRPYPLAAGGVKANDLSAFVSSADPWTSRRLAELRRLFYDQMTDHHTLFVLRANGHLTGGDSIITEFVPYALLRPDSTALNPRLPR